MLHLSQFVGCWRLERTIEDRRAGQTATMTGEVRFIAQPDSSLLYDEVGELRIGGGPGFEARRQYIWTEVAHGIDVRFADGLPFHHIVPAGQAAGTDHRCGEDDYRVRYDFATWPRWVAVWTVSGPRKDYTSRSVFQPPDTANGLADGAGTGQ